MRLRFILLQVIFFCFTSFSQSNASWLKTFGGTKLDMASNVVTDQNGNVYFSGIIRDTVDFDPGPGVVNIIDTSYWSWNAYLCKLDPYGELIWVKHFATTGHSTGNNLEIDKKGYLYLSGQYSGTIDVDPGPGTFDLVTNNNDFYICKLNSSGDLIWGKSFEVADFNGYFVNGLSIDTIGNIYACGELYGVLDLDPGPAVYTVQSMGSFLPGNRSDCFICKLDSSGNFVWAKTFGGIDHDHAAAVHMDSKGNICLMGNFFDKVDFDPGPAIYNLESPNGLSSFFIMKLNDQGQLIFAESIYGDFDWNGDMTLDSEDNIYCTGYFKGEIDFDPGAPVYKLRSPPGNSSFVMKLDAIGNFIWARSKYKDKVWHLSASLDKHDNLYVTGADESGFVEIYTPNGYLICSAKSSCFFSSVRTGQNDEIYLCGGFFNKQNIELFGTEYKVSSKGNTDIFVAKLPSCKIREENVAGLNGISIYPNPSNGNFTAYSPLNIGKKCRIDLYNTLGEKVLSNYIEVCNSSEEFSLHNYPKGVYFVRIDYSGATFSEKIILQ